MRNILAILVFISGLAACSTSGTNPPGEGGPHVINLNDTTIPTVQIYSPTMNQSFVSGDTIKVRGRVDDNGLYRGFIRITNDATSGILKEQLFEIHGFTFYNFSLDYKTSVTAVSDYTITVQFEDHGLNAGNKTVQVKINP